ncbi:hypothetical protein P7K49_029869 [Saguinus oedipus]|uniref:Uncharacterized protein n=1 Tax=Saguinus oedipus TaxID=9490 RepID=A0ABQ9U996_SAGOE|nr:hypothetical protein P7K49_029869 [Saguinus oedipus]
MRGGQGRALARQAMDARAAHWKLVLGLYGGRTVPARITWAYEKKSETSQAAAGQFPAVKAAGPGARVLLENCPSLTGEQGALSSIATDSFTFQDIDRFG